MIGATYFRVLGLGYLSPVMGIMSMVRQKPSCNEVLRPMNNIKIRLLKGP